MLRLLWKNDNTAKPTAKMWAIRSYKENAMIGVIVKNKKRVALFPTFLNALFYAYAVDLRPKDVQFLLLSSDPASTTQTAVVTPTVKACPKCGNYAIRMDQYGVYTCDNCETNIPL